MPGLYLSNSLLRETATIIRIHKYMTIRSFNCRTHLLRQLKNVFRVKEAALNRSEYVFVVKRIHFRCRRMQLHQKHLRYVILIHRHMTKRLWCSCSPFVWKYHATKAGGGIALNKLYECQHKFWTSNSISLPLGLPPHIRGERRLIAKALVA